MLPKVGDGDFVCAMEDVLEVYARPYDAKTPVVCVDETSKQLVADVTPPEPMRPGKPARQDYEYERCGTANLFMICEPLGGWRHVKVTERRTKGDFADILKELSDVHFPDAEKIVLVYDNLSTHKLSVLYDVFPPTEARRIHQRFEIHPTPKHGSWLNIAECELAVLGRQCLDRHIDNPHFLNQEVTTWTQDRNTKTIGVNWQFKTDEARTKLQRLYPKQIEAAITSRK